MDVHLAQLDARVATLTDAWLAGDRDEGVPHRLEAAVAARRAYLPPPLLSA